MFWKVPVKDEDTSQWVLPKGHVFAGRYRVIKQIGSGKTGVVYEVADTHLNDERIAVKHFYSSLLQEEDILQRVQRELLLARHLNHRNIVRIFDINLEPGSEQFVSMELVHGFSLREVLNRVVREFTEAEVIAVCSQVLEGLEYAHNKGVIHRDVKPENILIDASGQIKLTDFASIEFEDDERLTKTGQVVGTPAYMSPEQFRGEALSAQSDIYAVGVLCYELLNRVLPFSEASYLKLAEAHLQREADFSRVQEKYSHRILELLKRLLAKEPDERPRTAFLAQRWLDEEYNLSKTETLSIILREYLFDSRYSEHGVRFVRLGQFYLVFAILSSLTMLIMQPKMIRVIHGDLLRVENYFNIDAPVLRSLIGLPDISLSDFATVHDALSRNDIDALHTWCSARYLIVRKGDLKESPIVWFLRKPAALRAVNEAYPDCLADTILDFPNEKREPPVYEAVKSGNVAAVHWLVQAGFAANADTLGPRSALSLAVEKSSPAIAAELLSSRDIFQTFTHQQIAYALFRAIELGSLPMVEALLKGGVSPLLRDLKGRNALMYLRKSPAEKRKKLLPMLLDHGASCRAHDDRGDSVEKYLREYKELAELLSSCNANE